MHIRIAITDDHPMVVSGLKNMLYYDKHMEICSTYSNGKDLLAGLEQEQPDILLLDIQLPDIMGNELARTISKKYPDIGIIAITSQESSFHVKDMMSHGCRGYLSKTVDQKTLKEAIETVFNGDEFLEPALKEDLLRDVLKSRKETQFIPSLTKRENEILQLIIEGNTSQEIATKLFLSNRTIENHRFSLMQKLRAKNTAALVKTAQQMGLA